MTDVTPDEFVMAWQVAESAREVDELFGKRQGWAACRAVRYRKAGVKLKRFIGKWNAIADRSAHLNAIIGENT